MCHINDHVILALLGIFRLLLAVTDPYHDLIQLALHLLQRSRKLYTVDPVGIQVIYSRSDKLQRTCHLIEMNTGDRHAADQHHSKKDSDHIDMKPMNKRVKFVPRIPDLAVAPPIGDSKKCQHCHNIDQHVYQISFYKLLCNLLTNVTLHKSLHSFPCFGSLPIHLISNAPDCFDKLRCACILMKLLADPCDMRHDGIIAVEIFLSPDRLK